MHDLIPDIYATLRSGQPLVLATIVSQSGSTPRTAGASMLIHPDGAIAGTIGGGRVEAVVMTEALGLFASKASTFARYDLTESGDMDLVCGGEMQVVSEYLAPNSENLAMLALLNRELECGRNCAWLGKLTDTDHGWRVERAVRSAGNGWQGGLTVTPQLQRRLADIGFDRETTELVAWEGERYLLTAFIPRETVCLMGGGHVSQEIARLTKQVAFRTLVFDDRAEFANPALFPEADGVFVCDDFAKLFSAFEIPAGSYIVIVTRGHRHDKEVLAQALRSDAAYLGMIGSRRKRESVYRDLVQEGFEENALKQVHCPIGLSIDAETPAEIAVSVVAELIQHRAKRKLHG